VTATVTVSAQQVAGLLQVIEDSGECGQQQGSVAELLCVQHEHPVQRGHVATYARTHVPQQRLRAVDDVGVFKIFLRVAGPCQRLEMHALCQSAFD
jgi:hypothetical protein